MCRELDSRWQPVTHGPGLVTDTFAACRRGTFREYSTLYDTVPPSSVPRSDLLRYRSATARSATAIQLFHIRATVVALLLLWTFGSTVLPRSLHLVDFPFASKEGLCDGFCLESEYFCWTPLYLNPHNDLKRICPVFTISPNFIAYMPRYNSYTRLRAEDKYVYNLLYHTTRPIDSPIIFSRSCRLKARWINIAISFGVELQDIFKVGMRLNLFMNNDAENSDSEWDMYAVVLMCLFCHLPCTSP
jgi:hypothetical protein